MGNGDFDVDAKGATPTPKTPLSARHHKKSERSCLMCHQRKIRCDKKVPCSHCLRADVLCCYPAPERISRRPPKTTTAEVAARLARLERTITAISNGASTQPDSNLNSTSALSPSQGSEAGTSENQNAGWPTDELLIQDGYSSHYINEALLSRILEEERELLSLLGGANVDSSSGRKPSSFDFGGLFFSFGQSMTDTQSYHPSRWHAMQLWQAFVTNVDPVIKILHIPTTQSSLFAAISNANHVDDDLSALLFSIYFAATTSLTSTDAANLLGQSKSTALSKFKQGLEHSLAGANFLDTPSMKSLQAMTIYLTCLRAYSGGRAVWTLNGLAIRSAQSMGLHRDGRNFNLSPFESEMRRRLWWYMCSQDSRAAEDHGITLGSFDGYSDTSFPLNLNDSELSPDMQGLPAEKAKWTDMSFCLNMMKISDVFHRLYRTPGTPFNTSETGESSKLQILNGLKTHLEDTILKHCDPNIPAQRFGLLTTRLRLEKVDFLVSNQWLNCRDSSEQKRSSSDTRTTEIALAAACHTLEKNLQIQLEDILQGFRWFSETMVQYYVLIYVLWHLCVKPVGPGVGRAWKAVEESFEVTERHKANFSSEAGSKWTVVQRLRDKAIQIRDHPRGETEGGAATVGGHLQDLPSEMEFSTREFGDITSDLAFGEGADWEMSMTDFPDWNNFVEKFEMEADGFCGDIC